MDEVTLDLTGARLGAALDVWEARGLTVTAGSPLAAAMATSLIASELPRCEDLHALLASATEFARSSIGLERVAFYLREPGAGLPLLRGCSGTGARGQTTDERSLSHELSSDDALTLQTLRANGACALYRPRAQWFAFEGGKSLVLGEGWVMVTPLISGNQLLGVIYNDAALTRSAPDPSKQAALAVLGNLVSIECAARRDATHWAPLFEPGRTSRLVQQVRQAVDQDLATSGNELAVEFGVSPGHLARAFKREMGVSLVEYRNRKRIDRFREVMRGRGHTETLKTAAIEAGFGSYAQFHRVHKKFGGDGAWHAEGHAPASSAPSQQSYGPWPPLR